MPQMKDIKDASDGIRTRASFFRRIDLPGTPYISILPEYINTRLRASPTNAISSNPLHTDLRGVPLRITYA